MICDLQARLHEPESEAVSMLLVLSEEHKEHLGFLTKVDVDGKQLLVLTCMVLMPTLIQW